MKIKIISAYAGSYKEYIDISSFAIERYCSKHNYDYSIYSIPHTFNRPHSWFKISKFLEILANEDYDYTLWLDADATIVSINTKLESFIKENKNIYISKDMNNINCGIILIKNDNLTKQYLDEVWNKTKYINHHWWEQAAFIELIDSNFSNICQSIEYLDQSIFNAYDYNYYTEKRPEGQVNDKSIIFHAPGLSHDTRLNLIKKYTYKD